jgi:hypothetical protein
MLDTLQSVSLLTMAEILGPVILAAALIYGIMRSRGRQRAREQEAHQKGVEDARRQGAAGAQERHSRAAVFAVGAVIAIVLIAAVIVGPQYASNFFSEGGIGSPGNPQRPGSTPPSTK